MTDKTKQKIMDTALKIFAERGYTGATTKALAEEAGFSEMTLFRKFKSKENLFNMVLLQNREKIINDLDSIFIFEDIQNPRDFLKSFIEGVIDLIDGNFECISILVQGNPEIFPVMKGSNSIFFSKMGENMANLKIFQNSNIDLKFFAFNLITFSYFIVLDKYRGQNSLNRDELLKEFINCSAKYFELK